MTKEQAINYLKSSGFSNEAISEIILALTSEEELPDPVDVLRDEIIDDTFKNLLDNY